jgi:ribosomal peptide maturation radical SAM protein 1
VKVLLVNMPGSSIRPPLGIGLLKQTLVDRGIDATVFNANVSFANQIGIRFYHYICEGAPPEALLFEWVFAHLVFEDNHNDDYLSYLMEKFPREFPKRAIARLLGVRDLAGAFIDECNGKILDGRYDFVGFASSFAQNMPSLALGAALKLNRPETVVAFGGANCQGEMGLALHRNFTAIDLVFSGEAEISLPAAIDALEAGRPLTDVPGVISRSATGTSQYSNLKPQRIRHMDDLPFPDYEEFFRDCAVLPGSTRIGGVPMETSRGCWWGEKSHCTFCGLNADSMTFRSKSAERALAEIEYLEKKFDVTDIQMVDNILDLRYLKTLCPALAERRSKVTLFYQTKANLTPEHLKILSAAGIRALQVGIESLDTQILKLMDKGLTGLQSIQLLKHCREAGIWPHWNILFGFPGELEQAYEEMAGLVDAISHLDPPNVCIRFRLDRFSPLFVDWERRGLKNVRPVEAYRRLYRLPPEEIRDIAYYFDFDYADDRDPASYTVALSRQVQRWQTRKAGDLLYVDDSETLRLIDTRFGSRRELDISGVERRVYLRCLVAQPVRRLSSEFVEHFAHAAEMDELIDRWVRMKLMLRLDGRCLSLAVDREALASQKTGRKPSWDKVMQESLKESGDGISGVRSGLFRRASASPPDASRVSGTRVFH